MSETKITRVTREHCDYTMYVVDKSTPTPGPALVVKKFRTPVGQPLITDITSNVNPNRLAAG